MKTFRRLDQHAEAFLFSHFLGQILSRIRGGTSGDFFRCTGHDKITALISSFRSQIDDIVGTLDDVHVVFDNHDGMSAADQCIESLEQFLDVVEMKSGSRLIEHENGWLCLFDAQEISQLDTLVFTS